MCHAATQKIIRFGLIRRDYQIKIDENFLCVGDAVKAARGNDDYFGVITRIFRTDGTVFSEKYLIKNSKHEEFTKSTKKKRSTTGYSTMDF